VSALVCPRVSKLIQVRGKGEWGKEGSTWVQLASKAAAVVRPVMSWHNNLYQLLPTPIHLPQLVSTLSLTNWLTACLSLLLSVRLSVYLPVSAQRMAQFKHDKALGKISMSESVCVCLEMYPVKLCQLSHWNSRDFYLTLYFLIECNSMLIRANIYTTLDWLSKWATNPFNTALKIPMWFNNDKLNAKHFAFYYRSN